MFGFIGKHQGQLIGESAGNVSGSTRNFFVRVGGNMIPHLLTNPLKEGFLIFDLDNVSATKPNEVWADITSNAYGKEAWTLLNSPMSNQAQIINRVFDESAMVPLGEVLGWRYTSSLALTPTTRKFKAVFVRPEFVESIVIWPVTNNQARTAASNTVTGTLDLDLNQFPNLVGFSLNEAWITVLNLKAQNLTKLKYFEIRELLNISTINGKLPACTERIKICTLSSAITSINELISFSTACKTVQLGHYAPSPGLLDALTTLTGTLELSHMTVLEELAMSGCLSLSSISLPAAVPWRIFQVENSDTAFGAIANSYLDAVLACSTLVYFGIHSNGKIWARNFANADISAAMQGMYVYGNSITGNFIKTDAQLNMVDLRLGINATEGNRFANIDLSGFSGGSLKHVYFAGVLCENLILPTSLPSVQQFIAFDNKLSISANPDLLTKIAGYTSLLGLSLGDGGIGVGSSLTGQDSVDGLGANPDLSALTSLNTLNINSCKITGTLTLPGSTNKISSLNASENPGLTALGNFLNHKTMFTLRTRNCSALSFAIPSVFTQITTINVDGSAITSIDLTGRTQTQNLQIICNDCPSLTEIKFAPAQTNSKVSNSGTILAYNCASLASLVNMDQVNWAATGANNNGWWFYNCALNLTFPFGVNNFIPSNIQVQDNGMSAANVDATIMSIHNNRTKWSVYTAAKSLNISGTNAAPTGIFQAPAVSGSPANANEAAWELVNLYGWTITTN